MAGLADFPRGKRVQFFSESTGQWSDIFAAIGDYFM